MTVSRVLFALSLVGCGVGFDEPEPEALDLPSHIFPTPTLPAVVTESRNVCDRSKPGAHCHAIIATENGQVRGFAAPNGFGPQDLQSAYNIDPTLGAGVTVAIVDAFGYPKLESDLAMYRSTFSLPPCTIASGCLKIVNDSGESSPLPPLPPSGEEDWTIETALDLDMVSSGCPMCNILVVQTSAPRMGLYVGQMVAARLGANVISDSWGSNEIGGENAEEGNFDVPGVATFASTGDSGNNGGVPQYPATSGHVIAVGGTNLAQNAGDPRGWSETAWSLAGSSCSNNIAKPAFQTSTTGCTMRASADVSAVADPSTGLAVYDSDNGNPGFIILGGTSASSPLVAAMFAGAGHGDTSAAFVYKHSAAFLDVTTGGNGSCGAPLCTSGPGWDGPTGLGSPDQAKVMAVMGSTTAGPGVTITFPSDGQTVKPGFTIEATSGANMLYMNVLIDGTKVTAGSMSPFDFSSPTTLANGTHTIQVDAFDESHNSSTMSIMVDVEPDTDMPPGDMGGCCSIGGSGSSSAVLALGLGALLLRRRRS